MSNSLISTRIETYTVARAYLPSDQPVGTVVTNTFALVKREGYEAREFPAWLHEGCAGGGYQFALQEAWSDDTRCTGCDFYSYHGIGD